jgi:hypothetical protein
VPTVGYLFPFGATKINNIEFLNESQFDTVFFCYDQEPLIYNYNKTIFNHITAVLTQESKSIIQDMSGYSTVLDCNLCITKTISIKSNFPTVLLNTEKNSQEKNKILSEFNFIDCYYFFHGLAAADWYRGYEYCADILPLQQRKIKKKFISFNRITGNSRVYRSFLVAELIKRNLIDFGHVSYSRTCPVHGELKLSLSNAKRYYNLPTEYIYETFELLTKLPAKLRIDTSIDHSIQNDSFTIGPISQSIESFLYVVTETCFWDSKQHLTEKIFKPSFLKQPFVLIGCANNLSYLKEYGFKTFDCWWNEDYDQIQDPISRLKAVCDIIENICKLSNSELENLLIEMQEVLEYNYNRFYSKDFVQDLWKELSINLENAITQLPPPTSQET